jgi:hypothetical protein
MLQGQKVFGGERYLPHTFSDLGLECPADEHLTVEEESAVVDALILAQLRALRITRVQVRGMTIGT